MVFHWTSLAYWQEMPPPHTLPRTIWDVHKFCLLKQAFPTFFRFSWHCFLFNCSFMTIYDGTQVCRQSKDDWNTVKRFRHLGSMHTWDYFLTVLLRDWTLYCAVGFELSKEKIIMCYYAPCLHHLLLSICRCKRRRLHRTQGFWISNWSKYMYS